MSQWYAITGRVCGDDEDTVLIFEADSKEDATREFIEQMWEMDGRCAEDREAAENEGAGIFINSVVRSSTPIEEV